MNLMFLKNHLKIIPSNKKKIFKCPFGFNCALYNLLISLFVNTEY